MSHRFEDVLDECVEQLLEGACVERCLVPYPRQEAQLEPLLRVAVAAKRASSLVRPRTEFRVQTRNRILSLLNSAR
jgi:hypothetical protein